MFLFYVHDLVVKLGPENEDGKYAYSAITTPSKSMMWILARNTETFRKQQQNWRFRLSEEDLPYFLWINYKKHIKKTIACIHSNFLSSIEPKIEQP